MAHLQQDNSYDQLINRLNRFPLGAAPQADPTETLYTILKLIFSPREAELAALMPIKPFTAQKASRIWGMKIGEAQRVLDELASRAVLVDVVTPSGER